MTSSFNSAKMSESTKIYNKCHVLDVREANTKDERQSNFDDLALFTSQELDTMDFSQLMDSDEILDDTGVKKGIQAEDLSSLLEQFEATESTDSSLFQLNNEIKPDEAENKLDETLKTENDKTLQETVSQVETSKVVDKIRANQVNKRKAAIMLPMSTVNKRHRSQKSDAPGGLLKLKCTIQQNTGAKCDQPVINDWVIQDVISDHDYCSSTSSSIKTCDIPSTSNRDECSMDRDASDVGISVSESSVSLNDSVDMTISQESKDSGVEEGEILDSEPAGEDENVKQSIFFPCPRNLKSKRSYRKHETPMLPDASKYYDKIPAYFTTLSLPQKPPKKDKMVAMSGLCMEDYLPRDRSPTRESDSMYSKLPAYYSCFTNSTKYDEQEGEVEIKVESTNEFNEECNNVNSASCSRRSSRSRSCSSSSVSGSSRSSSDSRASSRGRSYDRYRRGKRRKHSCSSSSQSSSRSRSSSWSSSCSSFYSHRSRSRSSSLHSDRHKSSHEKSTIPRRYRSRSKTRTYRSRSRHRSYSRSLSRNRSLERRRRDKKERRQKEKQREIAERRIVYVGRIPNDYTKKDLMNRFERFGDIAHLSTHFREAGDNYGFVTFAYTCDAYAAIEKGNGVPGELKFELCFGGRRQFCDTEYADLDGKNDEQDMFESFTPKASVSDFDELLRQAKQKQKRKR